MSKAEKTRQFIIEKTAPVFNKKGYVGTSLNDMIEVTGLTKGSIYGNFENKDEVMIAAFEYNLKMLRQRFNTDIGNKATYKEKLYSYPERYRAYFDKLIASGGCPIQNTAVEADDTHPVLKDMAMEAILSWKNSIVNLIEKGIEAGEFKASEINPERVALTMVATIEGAVLITRLTGRLDHLGSIMDSVKKMIDDLG